jgi:hypothetical protein
MRRTLVVVLALIATLGVVAPPAMAQAPTTKVTISGILDTLTGWNHNVSYSDNNITQQHDREWYSRQRFRPDFTFELGKAKAVWGVEMDVAWGQASFSDTASAGSAFGSSTKTGTTANFDLNTDTNVTVETKWLYTSFPVPWVPMDNTITLGAQPWAATYKPGVLATGDFPGVNWVINWAPNIKTHFAYAQIEESVNQAAAGGTTSAMNRGDDFAIVLSVEVSPMKGLDVRPIYSYLYANGLTSGAVRANTSSLPNLGIATYTRSGDANDIYTAAGRSIFRPDDKEHRHTIGFDARWKWGNLSVDPTVLYQWGSRETSAGISSAGAVIGNTPGMLSHRNADINAWLVDARVGYQLGPLNLGLLAMYSTGNAANSNVRSNINYFQPISTDTLYTVGWSELLTAGIDYLTQMHTGAAPGNPLSMVSTIGYDKYGRTGFAVRAIYDLTPSFSLRGIVNAYWTAEEVDTNVPTGFLGNREAYDVKTAALCAAAHAGVNCDRPTGNDSYLGTEVDFGFTWRFAPGLTLDGVYAHLFAGSARDAAQNVFGKPREAEDVSYSALRVRYAF